MWQAGHAGMENLYSQHEASHRNGTAFNSAKLGAENGHTDSHAEKVALCSIQPYTYAVQIKRGALHVTCVHLSFPPANTHFSRDDKGYRG